VRSQPRVPNQQRQGVVPSAATPMSVSVPMLHVDPTLITQIVWAVIEAMPGARSCTLICL
jgi:hypothetical protein